MRDLLQKFAADELGATAIEYALIASLIAVAIVGSLLAVNEHMTGLYAHIDRALDPALRGE